MRNSAGVLRAPSRGARSSQTALNKSRRTCGYFWPFDRRPIRRPSPMGVASTAGPGCHSGRMTSEEVPRNRRAEQRTSHPALLAGDESCCDAHFSQRVPLGRRDEDSAEDVMTYCAFHQKRAAPTYPADVRRALTLIVRRTKTAKTIAAQDVRRNNDALMERRSA